MAKGTYSEVQRLDKGGLLKKAMIIGAVFVVLLAAVLIFRAVRSKPKAETMPEAVTTPMVPSTIKYYDPSQEKTYDTGADYIVLTDGSTRIRVDSAGNVSYVSETGQVTGSVQGDERAQALEQALSVMKTDGQASMALAGLEDRLPKDEPTPAETKELTNDEALRALLDEMAIPYEDFVGQVYGLGSTLGDVYTMLWMYDDDEGVIESIMQASAKQEDESPKSVSVTVEKLGGTEAPTSITDTGSSSYEYPSWMQESDPTDSLNAMVETLSALSGSSGTSSSSWENANRQSEKSSWLEGQRTEDAGYKGKVTKYDLVAGTVIPITLVTGINTDLPGDVVGLVRQDVYDTLTGSVVLIPKGSRVMASYNSSVTFGQKSIQVAWTQLITPDGYVYTLPGFQGVSQEGYSGVEGKVNNHFWAILGGAVLGSIINYGANTIGSTVDNAAQTIGNEYISGAAGALTDSALDTTANFGMQYTSRWANMQPTIKVRTGAQIQMLVNQTVNFKR